MSSTRCKYASASAGDSVTPASQSQPCSLRGSSATAARSSRRAAGASLAFAASIPALSRTGRSAADAFSLSGLSASTRSSAPFASVAVSATPASHCQAASLRGSRRVASRSRSRVRGLSLARAARSASRMRSSAEVWVTGVLAKCPTVGRGVTGRAVLSQGRDGFAGGGRK